MNRKWKVITIYSGLTTGGKTKSEEGLKGWAWGGPRRGDIARDQGLMVTGEHASGWAPFGWAA